MKEFIIATVVPILLPAAMILFAIVAIIKIEKMQKNEGEKDEN